MEYLIYTYGGGELLVSIFNAVGMIFESDSKYLTPVGSTAMILGGVYAAIKASFGGDIALVGKKWMIPSAIAFLFLFSPKTTMWVKDGVMMNAPVKIDNIPIGISFFTSLSSNISHRVSILLEEAMLPPDAPRSTTTGILYGAKAVAKIRDIQIQNPTLLRNTKEYMRQCYMKPYIIGNFAGLRAEAMNAPDILQFLIDNPVKVFGVKLSDDNHNNFKTCTAASSVIKNAIEAEAKSPIMLTKFGTSLGFTTKDNNAILQQRIKSMTSGTLGFLEKNTGDIHEWMKQAMILNANRESYDDWRQKVGHQRVFPELVKMQATRGMFHQAFGSIVGAEMAESMIPVAAQPVMLALVVMCFVIILPLAMLPGGWNFIVTGIKLMIWVCSWPVFYTIIHCIVMLQMKGASEGWVDSGLTMLGQGGFTELILWKYAAAQSLITSVPFISFAIVFGSPYALSSIAGSVAGVSAAGSLGANMADGNLSMSQVSLGNTTKNQTNDAPTLLMGGGVIDDGALRVMSDNGGSQIVTEYQHNMASNYKVSDASIAQASQGLSSAQSQMASLSERESAITSKQESQTLDTAWRIAQGTSQASNLSVTDQEALRKGFSISSSTSTSANVVDSQSTGTSSNLGVNIPGFVTKVTGLSGGTSTNASNNHEVRTDMSSQERQDFNTALEQVKTAARTDSITGTTSEDKHLNKAFSNTVSELDQVASDKAKTQQDIDTYTSQLSYLKTNSGSIDRNVNDQVMQAVMVQNPTLSSKQQAARWMSTHRAEADAIAKPIIESYNPLNSRAVADRQSNIMANTQNLKSMEIASTQSLKSGHQETTSKLEKSGGNLGYNNSTTQALYDSLNTSDARTFSNLEKGREKYAETQQDLAEGKADKSNSTIVRVVENIGNDATSVIDAATGNNQGNKK